MLVLPSSNTSGSPELELNLNTGEYQFIPPQSQIYQHPSMSDELIQHKADTEGDSFAYLSFNIGNDALTGVNDMPVAREGVAILHQANGTAGSGGLDAIYGDGYSEALVLHLHGQLSPSNPHYNTIIQQQQTAQFQEIQNQQTYSGVVYIWNNSPISGLENIVSDSAVSGINDFNSSFINNLESTILGS